MKAAALPRRSSTVGLVGTRTTFAPAERASSARLSALVPSPTTTTLRPVTSMKRGRCLTTSASRHSGAQRHVEGEHAQRLGDREDPEDGFGLAENLAHACTAFDLAIFRTSTM